MPVDRKSDAVPCAARGHSPAYGIVRGMGSKADRRSPNGVHKLSMGQEGEKVTHRRVFAPGDSKDHLARELW